MSRAGICPRLGRLMIRHRARRLATAFIAVLSLLFSQLALASYVCPGQPDVAAMAAMAEAGVPCEGMDSEQPVLCFQYAADAAQTFEAVKVPVAGQPAVVQVLELPLAPGDRAARAVPPPAPLEARPSPGPLFLATLRLRV